jgi:hypothetical protein
MRPIWPHLNSTKILPNHLHSRLNDIIYLLIKGGEMDSLYAIFGWGSPVGTGLFLVFLGTFIYLLSRVDRTTKQK